MRKPNGYFFTIREAYDGATYIADLLNERYWQIIDRQIIPTPMMQERRPGDADRTVDDFEKTFD